MIIINTKDAEKLEKYKNRVKKQNEAAKNNWDCVSLRLPKGTKDRITGAGYTVNGLINTLVLDFLGKLESEKENKWL